MVNFGNKEITDNRRLYRTLEEKEQMALIEWSEMIPDIRGLLCHIPNGGFRLKTEASRLKKMGVRAGFPDLFLPVARGKYHGLFMELKIKPNIPSLNQKQWLAKLEFQGYRCAVCYGWEESKILIEDYLKEGNYPKVA
jgi:hypothetical protein